MARIKWHNFDRNAWHNLERYTWHNFDRFIYNGLKLLLWTEDEDEKGNPDNLVVEAIVEFDEDEDCWVAVYEGKTIKHESEFNPRSEI